MEKIKASRVFKRLGFRYMWVEGLRSIIVSTHTRESRNGRSLFLGTDIKTVDLDRNEYEIDFSEDFTEERLDLIDYITSYLAKELSLRDYTRIVGFFEEMEKPDYTKGFVKSLDLEKEVPTKEPSSIFKIDDTVHVLSYSNIGEFGKSTEGIIKTIYKDGTVLVKVDEGVEEVHKEDNVSFTPFSIKEAGFSQVRPVQEPKIGDWGFFYDNKPATSIYYDKLFNIAKNEDFKYVSNQSEENFKYFSHTPPQLAADIPNPFAQC